MSKPIQLQKRTALQNPRKEGGEVARQGAGSHVHCGHFSIGGSSRFLRGKRRKMRRRKFALARRRAGR